MGTEYPDALDYWVDRSRVFVGQNSYSAIVLHGTGGSASQTVEQLGDWFRTNASSVSSHFGIGRDGRVAQYVSLADGSAANCCVEPGHDPFWDQFGGQNLNKHTISIECVNDISNSLPLTEPQKQALFKLIAWLCEKYNLGIDRIKTHQSIAPSSRQRCPGAAFPMEQLKAYLQNGGDMHTKLYGPDSADFSQRFTDQGNNTWRCNANGSIVMGENLTLYRTLSMTGDTLPVIGLPRTNELYQKDADGYEWSVQFFERGLIAYDPKHRKDSQPGMGNSYLGKYEQFKDWDPLYQAGRVIEKLPDSVIADIKALASPVARLIAAVDKSQ